MRASRPPVRTSRTPRCRRPGTTRKPASSGCRPRPAPASGARRWPLPARCSASTSPSSRCACSYDQKPYRRALMETYGARCVASPSNETECGRAILAKTPDSPGSLGIAISEAVEIAAKDPAVKYALGSVLNHVMLHQTIIGEEAIKQFEMAGDDPDVVIGCAGGGSNFAGLAFPFIGLQLRGGRKPPLHRGRAGGLPVADARQVRLRLRRHRASDAAGEDAHARLDLHAARLPRRRPALSRHGRRWCRTPMSSA